SGNYGQGSIYDITSPPVISSSSTRPRSFKDIPPVETFAFYAEDKFTLPIASTTLDIQAGIRINNFQPSSFSSGDVGIYAEPRLNARYKLIDQRSGLLRKISIHGGIGVNYKSPSLLYLYPDVAYFDIVSLDYYNSAPSISMAYFTTRIFDTSNADLKPAKNLKKEIGLEFKLGRVSGDITAYKEEMSDGFGMVRKYHFIDYKKYDATSTPPNTKPNINNLPYQDLYYIISHSYPSNNKATDKIGLEYSFNFGKIKPIQTTVMMNGAWMKTERNYSSSTLDYLPTKDENQYSEVGVYPSGEGNIAERMNTTFRFITHSSRLRLVFTTTMQITWMDKRRLTLYDETPLYLYSKDDDYIPFTDEMREDINYNKYVLDKGANYYIKESLPPLLLCNFKLSKEISDKIKLSFYANNFVNHRPLFQSPRTQNYIRRNPSIYFGAELNITL
ncbi:MAG: TonB-dependent receptor, partial [Bacteroidales bacterium]|nr:TonB-dependent receptor [Bacteroidales bacterium]